MVRCLHSETEGKSTFRDHRQQSMSAEDTWAAQYQAHCSKIPLVLPYLVPAAAAWPYAAGTRSHEAHPSAA